MKRLLLAVALALTALALPLSSGAGGWATVQLSSLPSGTDAGGTWSPELTVLQHGRTPLDDVTPVVRISNDAGLAEQFAARPTGKPGHYRADVIFPTGGTWSWEIWDGFSQTHTYAPVTIGDGPAGVGLGDGFPFAPVLGGALGALVLAGLAVFTLRRRRHVSPQPALDA